jgi:transcriptional regulator with XRE-family HTH domain
MEQPDHSIANSIAALRKLRGWSKAELARRSRLHPTDVGKIENGRSIPYPSQIKRLAVALRCTVETLTGEGDRG